MVNLNDDLWLVLMGKHWKVFAEILVLFNTEWFAQNAQTLKQNFGGSKIAANLGGASKEGYLQLRRIGITESVKKFGRS